MNGFVSWMTTTPPKMNEQFTGHSMPYRLQLVMMMMMTTTMTTTILCISVRVTQISATAPDLYWLQFSPVMSCHFSSSWGTAVLFTVYHVHVHSTYAFTVLLLTFFSCKVTIATGETWQSRYWVVWVISSLVWLTVIEKHCCSSNIRISSVAEKLHDTPYHYLYIQDVPKSTPHDLLLTSHEQFWVFCNHIMCNCWTFILTHILQIFFLWITMRKPNKTEWCNLKRVFWLHLQKFTKFKVSSFHGCRNK